MIELKNLESENLQTKRGGKSGEYEYSISILR